MVRLLTPENRQLLARIRDQKPQSVAELAALTGRAQPNLTRTLAKLEAAGFGEMPQGNRGPGGRVFGFAVADVMASTAVVAQSLCARASPEDGRC